MNQRPNGLVLISLAQFFAAISIVFSESTESTDFSGTSGLIFEGIVANVNEFRHMAFLSANTGNSIYTCGGSIISERSILTAAYCINGLYPHQITVYVGSNYEYYGTQYSASKLYSYPKKPSPKYDIGIIQVQNRIQFTNAVKPIRLSSRFDDITNVRACGWGLNEGISKPTGLLCFDVQTIPYNLCERKLNGYLTISVKNICTLSWFGQGTCRGGSGGPLIANGELIGVVSRGDLCAEGFPDVYARVAYYKRWIEMYM